MGEGLVGLGHPVGVLALLDGGAAVVRPRPAARRTAAPIIVFSERLRAAVDQPADGQRLTRAPARTSTGTW